MNQDSQVFKKIKRSNTTTILFSLVALVIVVVLVVISSGPYWLAQVTGPIEISADEILDLNGSEHLYNRAVSGEDMDDTYYYEETYDQDTGRQVSIDAYFGALEIGKDQWILVRSSEEINTREEDYVGTLQPISGDVTSEVYVLAADELNIEFLPIMLDTTRNETMWYVGTAVLLILGLASLWGIFAFIGRNADPTKHPILKKLSRFGNVDDIVHSIDKDLTMGEDSVGKLRLTKNYLVHTAGSNFDAMPYSAVAWVYKMVKRGRYGKTYEVHIYDVTGYQMVIVAKEAEVNVMLNAVAARAPHAIAGFSEDIKRMWNKERQSFIEQVNLRKQNPR